jgi:hypothetical protein
MVLGQRVWLEERDNRVELREEIETLVMENTS